jgi:hypothetical protein
VCTHTILGPVTRSCCCSFSTTEDSPLAFHLGWDVGYTSLCGKRFHGTPTFGILFWSIIVLADATAVQTYLPTPTWQDIVFQTTLLYRGGWYLICIGVESHQKKLQMHFFRVNGYMLICYCICIHILLICGVSANNSALNDTITKLVRPFGLVLFQAASVLYRTISCLSR